MSTRSIVGTYCLIMAIQRLYISSVGSVWFLLLPHLEEKFSDEN